MAHALLVADQHVNESLLVGKGSKLAEPYGNQFRKQTLREIGAPMVYPEDVQVVRASNQSETFSLEEHLACAQETLRHLAEMERHKALNHQFRRETAWLTANKHRYRGRWIAIEGDQLLAVGATSREVFSQLGTRTQPPLVVRIEEEDRPFAGW
jgi:hypothetical protein